MKTTNKTLESVRISTADTLVVTDIVKTQTTYERKVDYNDILDAVDIVPDDFFESPWEYQDGFDHKLETSRGWDTTDGWEYSYDLGEFFKLNMTGK